MKSACDISISSSNGFWVEACVVGEEIVFLETVSDKVKSYFSLYPLTFIMKKVQSDALLTLKKQTLNLMNDVIPMEKAIRKIAANNHESFTKLKQLNQEISDFWVERGLTLAEIKDSHILALSWDKLQFGSNGKYDPKIRLDAEIMLTLKENWEILGQRFLSSVRTLTFNDAPEYCYFNLANGNNLHELLSKFAKSKIVFDTLSRRLADKVDVIPLSNFITGIQEPLPYHSNSATVTKGNFSLYEKDQEQERILLDIRMEPELGSLKRIIIDFIKSYIDMKTESVDKILNSEDALIYRYINDPSLREARKLLAELQLSQFIDDGVDYETRLDSLQKEILKLILWDFKQTGLTDEKTIEATLELMQQLNLTVPELAHYKFVQDESLGKYLQKIKSELKHTISERAPDSD